MAKAKKLCSWDQEPRKGDTIFTCGNVNEVLPGVTRPLYADLAAWWDYYWCKGVVEELGVSDLVTVAPPPSFNQLAFMGGRWAVNVSFNLTLSSTWALGEGSSMLQSYFEGGDAIVSSAVADQSRAVAARAIISQKWANAEKLARANQKLSRASYAVSRRRRLHSLSDADLVALVEENVRFMGKLFQLHYFTTVGSGEYSSLLGGLLDLHFKTRPPEWVTMLTSGLGAVESARPGHALWEISRIIAARKSLAHEVLWLTSNEIVTRLAAPPNPDWEAFAVAYREFMAEFGWRGQRESDPSTPTWDEAPHFIIGAILADLVSPVSSSPHCTRRSRVSPMTARLTLPKP